MAKASRKGPQPPDDEDGEAADDLDVLAGLDREAVLEGEFDEDEDEEFDLEGEGSEADGAEGDEEALEGDDGEAEGGDAEGGASKAAKGAAKKASKKRKRADDDDAEIAFANQPVPSRKVMREALEWAFQGEEAPAEFLDRCAEHSLLVQDANRRMNLTKIVEPKEIAAKHYLDAWRTTRLLPLLGRSVLDLGSGAGYPGIPIALAEPSARVVLIESIEKKAAFLAESIQKLALRNAEAVCDRAEEHLLRHRYDVVVVRAVSSVRENVRLLRRVRHSLADLVMMKGPTWSREVRAGEREADRLGFRLDTVWEHELPGDQGGRAILVYRAPGGQGF